jgi:hypothetical protein
MQERRATRKHWLVANVVNGRSAIELDNQ